jgi:copper(I)-binding protein
MDHANHQDASAAAVSSTLTVTDCWIRALPEPAPSAGYFVVHNSGKTVAKLKSASSEAYGSVMLHQTTHDKGMSKMSMAHEIDIPANGTLAFKPGGFHAMLEKASKPVVVGTTIPMVFMFDSGEKAQAMCEVKPANTLAN